MNLNFSQKKAINYIKGPCLILAGAGSGKTKVIINKIIHLVQNCNFNAKKIVALTFTNKAAIEMKYKIFKKNNFEDLKHVTFSTFHALGLKIINSELKNLKIKKNFSLINEEEKIFILKKIVHNNFKKNIFFLKKLIFCISKWKNELLIPETVHFFKKKSEIIFFNYYQSYQIYIQSLNKLDFDDLIFLPTILLKENLNIRNRWKKKINYLLVDEYQDTNLSQYELIKQLNNNNSNFTLVGDDDQSIYSWRGAKPKNIFLLSKDFPNIKVIMMEHNYRSSGRILHVANTLISNNPHIFYKKLFSKSEYGSQIQILEGNNEIDEAKKIINFLKNHQLNNKTKYNDYAILYRSNYQSKILKEILLKNNIPYKISSETSFHKSTEIIHLIHYFRLIADQDDNFSFLKIINIPSRRIGAKTLNELKKWAKINKKSLFSSINELNIQIKIKDSLLKKLKDFYYLINKLIIFFNKNPLQALKKIVSIIGYEDWLKSSKKNKEVIQKKIKNINSFLNVLSNILIKNTIKSKSDLSKIISYLIHSEINDQKINENNQKVQIMTLHSSKGLEFSYVFIIGLEEGIIPYYSIECKNEIDEERRLIYVGITRAKKELFLSYSKTRKINGKKKYTVPSRFLFELPKKDICWDKKNFFEKKNFSKKFFHIQNLKNIIQKNLKKNNF
ncbi:UvrD-helicase domain-containing protein [Buchnera aphidicola]|uniref:UvrD-helicase domain-containing protein n=1 Tax=Buchnera aphidicola TaxID=9 RepID=UPI003463E5F2